LLIGKVSKRFLADKDGPVDCVEMRFLKPKFGSGDVLEDTPVHLPDISNVHITDIIAGPLVVNPQGSTQFKVNSYEDIQKHFNIVANINREDIHVKVGF